jgi:hypothetical protein
MTTPVSDPAAQPAQPVQPADLLEAFKAEMTAQMAAEVAKIKADAATEIAALKAKVEAATIRTAGSKKILPKVYDVLLANGQLIRHEGAIPTHVDTGEGVFRVLSATERDDPQ